MENENKESSTPLADSIKGMTEETAALLAEMFKKNRETQALMQQFYDDLVAFNPEGDVKPL